MKHGIYLRAFLAFFSFTSPCFREKFGTFESEGFAHETKRLLRLLVAKIAYSDDVRIWRMN